MKKKSMVDVALREPSFCLRLVQTLLDNTIKEITYMQHSEDWCGVRLVADTKDSNDNKYFIDVIVSEERDSGCLKLQADWHCQQILYPLMESAVITICLEGTTAWNKAVVRTETGFQAIFLNVGYTDSSGTASDLLGLLDTIRRPKDKNALHSELGQAFQKAIFPAVFLDVVDEAAVKKNVFTNIAKSVIEVPEQVGIETLAHALSRKNALEHFLSQLLGKDIVLSGEPLEADVWAWPLTADVWAKGESGSAYALTIQPNDFGTDKLFQILQSMAVQRMESTWIVHAIAICAYDALGAGKCYYCIKPAIDGLSLELRSRVEYYILCVPTEGMERNAPGEVQALLNSMAGKEETGELLQILQRENDSWAYSDEIKSSRKGIFAKYFKKVFNDMEIRTPFHFLHDLLNAYGEGEINRLVTEQHTLILYYRDTVEVAEMAKTLKLKGESVRKVLGGGRLNQQDLLP